MIWIMVQWNTIFKFGRAFHRRRRVTHFQGIAKITLQRGAYGVSEKKLPYSTKIEKIFNFLPTLKILRNWTNTSIPNMSDSRMKKQYWIFLYNGRKQLKKKSKYDNEKVQFLISLHFRNLTQLFIITTYLHFQINKTKTTILISITFKFIQIYRVSLWFVHLFQPYIVEAERITFSFTIFFRFNRNKKIYPLLEIR